MKIERRKKSKLLAEAQTEVDEEVEAPKELEELRSWTRWRSQRS